MEEPTETQAEFSEEDFEGLSKTEKIDFNNWRQSEFLAPSGACENLLRLKSNQRGLGFSRHY